MRYSVTVTRVSEATSSGEEITFEAHDVAVHVDGEITSTEAGGRGRSFSPRTWGAVTITPTQDG